jgi:hypothetical protein
MPCSHLILLGCFASTDKIAQRLGTPHREPIPPSNLRIDSNAPASQHPPSVALITSASVAASQRAQATW